MLAMIERNRVKGPDPFEASLTPSLYPPGSGAWDLIYSHAAEDARWRTVNAAVAFAGAREEELQRASMFDAEKRRIRDALELVTGFEPMPPPPVASVALRMGDHFPSVAPEAVHLQGWRDYLMTSTAAQANRPGIT